MVWKLWATCSLSLFTPDFTHKPENYSGLFAFSIAINYNFGAHWTVKYEA
jgi:hypothetical protein